MDGKLQQMRLIVYGAIGLYEGQGLDMAGVLREQGRGDLATVLDAIMTALYWFQAELAPGDE